MSEKYYVIPKDRLHEIEYYMKNNVDSLSEIISWFSEEFELEIECEKE